jgi:prophage regulatory protein
MSEHEQQAAQPAEPQPLSVSIDRVEKMIGLSKTTIYRMISDGEFPKPIMVGRRALWPVSRLNEWLKRQVQACPDETFDKAA